MPTDDNTVKPVDPAAVNMPAPASAPGADVPTVTTGLPITPDPMVTATDPLAQMPGEQKVEGMVPGAASTADVPVVDGASPADLPPKLPGEGEDTSNQGGVPPVQPGM